MKKFFKGCSIVGLLFSMMILILGYVLSSSLPKEWKINDNLERFELNSGVPLSTHINNEEKFLTTGKTLASGKTYNAKLKFMNIIPIKSVNIKFVEKKLVVPCGNPFGVKIFTEGVVVIGISDIKTQNGIMSPAKTAGLKRGDVILKINGKNINSNEDIAEIIERSSGSCLDIDVRRNNIVFNTKLSPCKSANDDLYKAGLWIRDSSAGIGTMTFFDPETNIFVGLGHGICDIDTGELLPLRRGEIVQATINGVKKGAKGNPGELRGYFNDRDTIGNLDANIKSGVYGHLKKCDVKHEPVTIAMKQQVKPGPAQIISTIDEDRQNYYDIWIKEVNYREDSLTKNMVIEITDEYLINKTGGIVQGMSGSPIIQNGMLAGAVTHVFVNDPLKGYAIFAENMIDQAQSIYTELNKTVS